MFGTLRYIPQGTDPSYIGQGTNARTPARGANRGDQHFACNRCRAKKLRCSGQKSGCTRCEASQMRCTYIGPSNENGSQRRARRRGTDNRDSSTSIGSGVGSGSAASGASYESQAGFSTTTPKPSTTISIPTTAPASPVDPTKASTPTPQLLQQSTSHTYERLENDPSDNEASENTASIESEVHVATPKPSSVDQQSSGEQDDSMKMTDWPSQLDEVDTFDLSYLLSPDFNLDGDAPSYDGEFLSSQFPSTKSFDLDNSVEDCRISDDSYFNLEESLNESINTPPPSVHQFSAQDTSHLQNHSLADVTHHTQHVNQRMPEQSLVPRQLSPIQLNTSLARFQEMASSASSSLVAMHQEACHCLRSAASMLEDIETKMLSEDRSFSVDAMMNFHQDVLQECTMVLLCRLCNDRSEKMMLLAMVCDKLTNICEIASAKCAEQLQNLDVNLTPTSMSSNSRDDASCTPIHRKQFFSEDQVLGSLPQSCGKFKVKAPRDWAYLVKILISMQLKALDGFLKRMKMVSFIARRETHLSILKSCEVKVQKITQNLRRAYSAAGERPGGLLCSPRHR